MNEKSILLHAMAFIIVAYSAYGQATFRLRNYDAPSFEPDAPVYDVQGVRLEGSRYRAELYGGRTPDSLHPAETESRSRLAVPFLSGIGAGYFSANELVVIFDVPGHNFAWLQIRAWDSNLGTTYEDVVARGVGGYGESPLFYAQGGFLYDQFGASPKPLIGLESFRLRPATGVLMKGIRREGEQVVVEWQPQLARYQVQQAGAIEGPWQNVGEPTTATSATNLISGSMKFFRVIGFLE